MIQTIKSKNTTSYRARICGLDGKQKYSPCFRQKTLAKEWERRELTERDRKKAAGIYIHDDISFAEFSERWLRETVDTRLAPSTRASYRRDVTLYLLPRLGDLPLKHIRLGDVDAIVRTMQTKGLAAKTINCTTGTLQALLNHAVETEYLAVNPLRRLRPLRESVREIAFLSDAEVKQFLRGTLRDPLYPIYLVALNTGMRRGELAALKWDRIDFIRNTISITRTLDRYGLHETTKSGRKRVVHMNPDIRGVMERLLREQRGEFVFSRMEGRPLDAHHLSRRFKRALKRAGLPTKYRFHDLRHTFASHFMMNGGNIYELQRLLGHHSLDMTERYAHLSPMHLERAIGIVSFNGTGDSEPQKGSELVQIEASAENS